VTLHSHGSGSIALTQTVKALTNVTSEAKEKLATK
jgi:hypothetical protein